jgi:HK97 family phage portal protein
MGLFRQIRASAGDAGAALDDRYWYHQGYGRMSASGVRVSPELALTLAAVYACVRVVSETIASLPLIIYRRLPYGQGKERANDHPLYRVLHDRPNSWMTSFEWVELMQTHIEMRGNAYNFIQPGPDSAIGELIPIHPDRVTVKRLPANRLQFQVRTTGQTETFTQEQILHFRGQSLDGVLGMGTVNVGSEVIGAGLGQQDYSARYWANDSKPGGVLEHPAKLSPEAYVRLKESFQEAQVRENRHKVAILEEGVKYSVVATNNKDSQFLETIQARRSEVCSLFRVPPHKICDLTRATFSNIESQNIEFATDCIRPRLVRFEKRLNADLIEPLSGADGNEYFCEFLMDALLRGDLKSRYEAYSVAIDHGWMSPNDARRNENMNPIADGDIYIRQMNTLPLGSDPATVPNDSPAEDDTAVSGKTQTPNLLAARLKDIATAAAERCVRKEVKSLKEIAKKCDANGRDAALAKFYSEHREFVMTTMSLSREAADEYINASKIWIANEGLERCIERIEREGALALGTLATGLATAQSAYLSTLAQSMRINQIHAGALLKKKITLMRDFEGRVSGAEVDIDQGRVN